MIPLPPRALLVQGCKYIKKHAPDAEFQGCCLQSKIGNMPFITDSSRQKYDGQLSAGIPLFPQLT